MLAVTCLKGKCVRNMLGTEMLAGTCLNGKCVRNMLGTEMFAGTCLKGKSVRNMLGTEMLAVTSFLKGLNLERKRKITANIACHHYWEFAFLVYGSIVPF
jgi:hypothetical protein